MNFPPYWARASANRFQCWRFSNVSEQDARTQAEGAVQAIAARFKNVKHLPAHLSYGYSDRPLREQILREFHNPNGERIAVITRNIPGCHVLNTARGLFIDIDFPEAPKVSWMKRWLAPAGSMPAGEASHESSVLAKAEVWARSHPGWGWRAYRTKAGLRLLATHDVFDPKADIVQKAFNALGADPLYQKLCLAQDSFRARLTPKPWRCGLHPMTTGWPWENSAAESRFMNWKEEYERASASFSTCRFVKSLGVATVHPELQPLVEVHDEATRIDQPLPLA